MGENTHYRIYGKHFDHDDDSLPNVDNAGDDANAEQAGFRLDSDWSDKNAFTVQGDAYQGRSGGPLTAIPTFASPFLQTVSGDQDLKGANVLARWRHKPSALSEMALQVYYDRARTGW